MPTYEYHCKECGHHLEVLQKISEFPLQECPKCHQPKLQRGPGGGIGLSFKGSGFYATDYRPQPSPSSCEKKDSTGCCPCSKSTPAK